MGELCKHDTFQDICAICHRDGLIGRLEVENAKLRAALKATIKGYVNLLETGRDRIVNLGGGCDPVDVMEAADPVLRSARAALGGDA